MGLAKLTHYFPLFPQFMRDELKENNKERHSSLHGNDSQISVDDLWTSWKQSEGNASINSKREHPPGQPPGFCTYF